MLNERRQQMPEPQPNQMQTFPPNAEQLAEMVRDAIREPGTAVELRFGNSQKAYSLVAFKDPHGSICAWTLRKLDGDNAILIWNISSSDQRVILQQLSSDFKNWNEIAKEKQFTTSQHNLPLPTTKLYAQGDLRKLQFANLVRLISTDKASGCLDLTRTIGQEEEKAVVYFNEGMPSHSVIGVTSGDPAFLELVGWQNGTFTFTLGPGSSEITITKNIDLLIMEGTYLNDHIQELLKMGLTPNTCLRRAVQEIGDEEFRAIAQNEQGISRTLQKSIFDLVDGKSPIHAIVKALAVAKAAWMPAVNNMIKKKLLAPPEVPLNTEEIALATADWSMIQAVDRSLIRADTGAYGYPALLYFLEMEFNRSSRYGKPFSFLLLQIGTKATDGSGKLIPLPQQAGRELVNLISRLKRKPDILGHYQNNCFALILPETDSLLAKRFASRLIEVLVGGPSLDSVAFSIGVAGCPHEAQDLTTLIKACVQSRQKFGLD
ncbi:MAG: hypothetical protein C0507_16395 [Cyanobacteria bacterium PR.3.49]|nr:hypothetical protein [Cyanobacteria bacterium PR.3.49]